jgi:lambda repressor-like predicted transcriptional regulator
MKMFISWSGARSKAVAELLKIWIKCVLQATDPWISTKDIDRGSVWFSEIYGRLGGSPVGIICLTAENKDKPWILFESGALAKGAQANRVCTLLIDLKPSDVEGPLAQFNHTEPTRESVWQLIKNLNDLLPENGGLNDETLKQVFEVYWPTLEKGLTDALNIPTTVKPPERSTNSILAEILELTRSLNQRVTALEPPIPVVGNPSTGPILITTAGREFANLARRIGGAAPSKNVIGVGLDKPAAHIPTPQNTRASLYLGSRIDEDVRYDVWLKDDGLLFVNVVFRDGDTVAGIDARSTTPIEAVEEAKERIVKPLHG